MINRDHGLSLSQQAKLLRLSRGSIYYQPRPTSEHDLRLMRKLDKLHTELPFAGARMLRDLLKLDGEKVGRKHVSTLMKKMGIEALYRKPNTSKKHPGHKIYPYLLRHLEVDRPNQVWAMDITYSAPNLRRLSRRILSKLEHVWNAFRETKEETNWVPAPC